MKTLRSVRLWLVLLVGVLLGGCLGSGGGPEADSPPPVIGTAQPLPTRWPTPDAPAAPAPPVDGGTAPAPAPPASDTPPDWSFVATADTWKDNPVFRRILQDASSNGDSLVVIGGDITPQGYPAQFDEYLNVVHSYTVPVVAAPGNHDILVSPATFSQYLPLRQSFDLHNAHFTLVDSSRLRLDADDLQWIAADLAATAQPLKFVVMHVPPFMPFPVPGDKEMQAGGPEFVALMEQYHVSAVFAGHLQAYQRMQRNGIPYIICGGGGSPPAVPAFLGGRYHYVRVDVRGNTFQDHVTWLDDVMPGTP